MDRRGLVFRLPDRLHVVDGVDHTERITIQHLLGHTSGLADYDAEAPAGNRS